MSSSTTRAQYEYQLGGAGRCLTRALNYADQMGLEATVNDISDLYYEVRMLLEDSINGKRRRLLEMDQPELPFGEHEGP